MGLDFGGGLANLQSNAEQVGDRYNDFLNGRIDETAVMGEARMKANAPWNDDVDGHHDRVAGAARAGLHTTADSEEESRKAIEFSHGVDYGVYLETKFHGRDQVIMPTVKAVGEEFMAGLEGSLSELDGH